jgi:hypothetical protein
MNLDLVRDGISIKQDFFDSKQVSSLNYELDIIFSAEHLSINGFLGHVVSSKYTKVVAVPTASIYSINLLEVACDVNDLLTNSGINEDLILSTLEIWQESGNPVPLFWHTDNRPGMIRCFLYLLGGYDDSGAFKYIKGSHTKHDQFISSLSVEECTKQQYYHHRLPELSIKKLQNDIYVASTGPGSLVMAQTIGYHGNMPRTLCRRVLVFEFQPRHTTDYPRSNIFIPSRLLTQRVISNISLFQNHAQSSPHPFGTDVHLTRRPAIKKRLLAKMNSYLLRLLNHLTSL